MDGPLNSSTSSWPLSPTQTCPGLRESTAIPATPPKGTSSPRGPVGVPVNCVRYGRVKTAKAGTLKKRVPATTASNPTAPSKARRDQTVYDCNKLLITSLLDTLLKRATTHPSS